MTIALSTLRWVSGTEPQSLVDSAQSRLFTRHSSGKNRLKKLKKLDLKSTFVDHRRWSSKCHCSKKTLKAFVVPCAIWPEIKTLSRCFAYILWESTTMCLLYQSFFCPVTHSKGCQCSTYFGPWILATITSFSVGPSGYHFCGEKSDMKLFPQTYVENKIFCWSNLVTRSECDIFCTPSWNKWLHPCLRLVLFWMSLTFFRKSWTAEFRSTNSQSSRRWKLFSFPSACERSDKMELITDWKKGKKQKYKINQDGRGFQETKHFKLYLFSQCAMANRSLNLIKSTFVSVGFDNSNRYALFPSHAKRQKQAFARWFIGAMLPVFALHARSPIATARFHTLQHRRRRFSIPQVDSSTCRCLIRKTRKKDMR